MPARKRTTKRTVKKTRGAPTKRRTIKKKKPAKKGARKSTRRGAAFGGYTINFQGCEHSLQDVFGRKPLAPSEMTKKLWAYVKRHKLNLK